MKKYYRLVVAYVVCLIEMQKIKTVYQIPCALYFQNVIFQSGIRLLWLDLIGVR